ncbi:MAG: tetratricopeptide repeat protein, partial [Phycisphaerae bacterium]|nr:tetratricopeptide repeat protein [Phycisphaerae bacterium]
MAGNRWAWAAGWSLVLAGLAGCNGEVTPEGKKLLTSAAEAFEAGNNQAAVHHVDAFMTDNSGSRRADEAYYLRGLARYRLKDLSGAESDLNKALGRTKLQHIRAHATNALGDIAYERGDMALAEHMYLQALEHIQRGLKPADHTHYRLGCVLQRQGRWEAADLHFDKVMYFFEGSELARLASRRVRCSGWSIQAGAFEKKANADSVAERLRRQDLQ